MLSCRNARAALNRELDRELPLDAALALDEHLATCAACRALSERANRLEEALLRLAEPPVEHVDVERNAREVLRRLVAVPQARAEAGRGLRRAAAVLAALALAATLAWIALRGGGVDAPLGPSGDAVALSLPSVKDGERPRDSAEPAPSSADEDPAATAGGGRAPQPEMLAAAGAPPDEPSDEPRFDAQRHERARVALRELLRSEGAGLPVLAPTAAVRVFAARIDEHVRGTALAGWPLARLAAALLDDPERDVARAALRYVGLRGDRLAALELERRAANDVEALLARADSGDETSEALARACVVGEQGARVHAALADWPATRAAALLEAALARGDGEALERVETRAALVALGAAALEPLLRLAQTGALERESAFAALAELPEIGRQLAELAARSRERFDVDLLVAAAAHVRSEPALPWVEALARDPRRRASAVRGLIAYATPRAFDALLGLRTLGWVDSTPLEAALGGIEIEGAEAVAKLGANAAASGDALRASMLLDLLIARADRAVVPALAALAASPALAPEERELAASAAGELGTAEDVPLLIGVLRTLGARDRRLAATVVAALHRLGGAQAVERALAGAPRRFTERVLDALAHPSVGSVSLVQLARALEPLLERDLVAPSGDQP